MVISLKILDIYIKVYKCINIQISQAGNPV